MTLPSDVATLAGAFYSKQAQTARLVSDRLQQAWATLTPDPWGWWGENGSAVVKAVQGGQQVAAVRGVAYSAMVAELQDAADSLAQVTPLGFVATDAAADDLLRLAVVTVDESVAAGATLADAKQMGLSRLLTLATTLVADAGRDATSVGTAVNPRLTGYYRKLRLPSCKRCAVLAGKWFEWNDGFKRHPRCDCVHVPAKKAYGSGFDPASAARSGKVTGLTWQESEAIKAGADVAQVVNATEGLYDAGFGLTATTSGTTVRGLYGRSVKAAGTVKAPGGRYSRVTTDRLTPAAIMRLADGDRDLTVDLLRRYGYIL